MSNILADPSFATGGPWTFNGQAFRLTILGRMDSTSAWVQNLRSTGPAINDFGSAVQTGRTFTANHRYDLSLYCYIQSVNIPDERPLRFIIIDSATSSIVVDRRFYPWPSIPYIEDELGSAPTKYAPWTADVFSLLDFGSYTPTEDFTGQVSLRVDKRSTNGDDDYILDDILLDDTGAVSPFISTTKRIGVDPYTWKDRLLAEDWMDGRSRQIIFDAGQYDFNDFDNVGIVTAFSMSNGGSLELLGRTSDRSATFIDSATSGVFSDRGNPLAFVCSEFRAYNLTFEGDPYVTAPNRVQTSAYPYLTVGSHELGNAPTEHTLGAYHFELGNIAVNNTAGLRFLGGGLDSDPVNVFLQDIYMTDISKNGQIDLVSDRVVRPFITPAVDGGSQWLVRIDNVIANAKNGPEGEHWDPANPGNSSHDGGGAAFNVRDFGPSSQFVITRFWETSSMYGSLNHDAHCLRLNSVGASDVQLTLRDCFMRSEFLAGHMSGDGGGPLWPFYYHVGGPAYPDEGSRPRLDFENVIFEGYISDEVQDGDEAENGPLWPPRYLVQCASSADYHFWDCSFRWDIRKASMKPPANVNVWDVRVVGPSSQSVWFHNCTRHTSYTLNPDDAAGTSRGAGGGIGNFYEDSETRRYGPDERWFRTPKGR